MKKNAPFLFLSAFTFLVLLFPASAETDSSSVPFRNPDLPLDKRLDDLIGRLTVEEKISQLMMDTPAIPHLGIPAYHWWNEALHGSARNGTATVFPQAIGLAATWDPVLHRKIADAISTEIRAKNNELVKTTDGASKIYQGLTIWSPNINIFRDPRWGRGQETYGEDPYLTGTMGVAFVQGLQGNDPHYLKTVATVKHFAVHSGPEELRHRFDAVISDRDLHETYLAAFEKCIEEGKAQSLMSAYNAIDGIPAPANHYLLTEMLRDTWGFQGAVVGDVDTVGDISGAHKFAKDGAEASALALKAGNDLCSGTTYRALPDALKRGLITEKDFDLALHRLFRLRFMLGQFDPAERVPYRQIPFTANNSPEHDELALQAARESFVLLKNNGYLPWDPKTIKNLVVLGPTAQDNGALIGNYSGNPKAPINLLKGIRDKFEPLGITVNYDAAVPLVTGFNEKGQPFPEGILFTDESKSTPGLKRELFDHPDFKGNGTTSQPDRQIDFYWNPAQPVPGIPVANVNARWTGVMFVPAAADYSLSLTLIGAASLYVDDKLVLSKKESNNLTETRTLSQGITLEAGHPYKIRIDYVQGHAPNGKISFGWKPPGGLEKALALAASADHILLTLGITPSLEGESMQVSASGFSHGDRTTLALPKIQQDLIAQVAALGKPFAVILTGSSSLTFDTSKPDAILFTWYYGQEGGTALAEELLGTTNPSGHLPVTFYSSDADLPEFTNYAMTNRTYRYFTGKPLFAFGYGLSYTTFAYDQLTLSARQGSATDSIQVHLQAKNTGSRAGDTVVQVYVHAVKPPVPMPLQQLVAFQRVSLKPDEAQGIDLSFPVKQLRRWDETKKAFVVDSGDYEIRVGSASDDTPLKMIFHVN